MVYDGYLGCRISRYVIESFGSKFGSKNDEFRKLILTKLEMCVISDDLFWHIDDI